jgi:predicted DNA-binding protein (UPF0251 family)
MFNKYYVFVPEAIDTSAIPDNAELTVNELERQRLVADAQVRWRDCPEEDDNKRALRKCA